MPALIWVDWLLLGVVLLSGLISLWRGFVREALSIVIWVLALYAAFRLTHPLAATLYAPIEVPSIRLAVAALTLVIAVLVVGSMLSWLLGKLVQSSGLSGTDRFLGMFFGLGRGLLTVTALVAVGSWTPLCADPWWSQSRLIPHLESLAMASREFLPANLREIMGACRHAGLAAPPVPDQPPEAAPP